MTLKELRKKARALKIKPYGLKKAELIKAIQRTEGNFDCFSSASDSCDQAGCLFRRDCLQ